MQLSESVAVVVVARVVESVGGGLPRQFWAEMGRPMWSCQSSKSNHHLSPSPDPDPQMQHGWIMAGAHDWTIESPAGPSESPIT